MVTLHLRWLNTWLKSQWVKKQGELIDINLQILYRLKHGNFSTSFNRGFFTVHSAETENVFASVFIDMLQMRPFVTHVIRL